MTNLKNDFPWHPDDLLVVQALNSLATHAGWIEWDETGQPSSAVAAFLRVRSAVAKLQCVFCNEGLVHECGLLDALATADAIRKAESARWTPYFRALARGQQEHAWDPEYEWHEALQAGIAADAAAADRAAARISPVMRRIREWHENGDVS